MVSTDKSKREQLERMIARIPDYRSRVLSKLFFTLTGMVLMIGALSFAYIDLSKVPKSQQCNIIPLSLNLEKGKVLSERQLFALVQKVTQYPGRFLAIKVAESPINSFTKINQTACQGLPDQILGGFFWWVLLCLVISYPAVAFAFVKTRLSKENCDGHPRVHLLVPAYITLVMLIVAYGSLYAFFGLVLLWTISRRLFKTSFNKSILEGLPPFKRVDYKRFSTLDRHVFLIGKSHDKPLAELTQALIKPARGELERTYVIYKWITSNISYDVQAFISNNLDGAADPRSVYKNRKGVCSGYSYLLVEMLQMAGVRAEVIDGYAPAFYRTYGNVETARPNHSWVGVRINDNWCLADPTWDAGGVDPRTGAFAFKRGKFSHFLASPTIFVKQHLPIIEDWQLLESPISKVAFFKAL
jgi:uncharacterized protein (DUF2237 family)